MKNTTGFWLNSAQARTHRDSTDAIEAIASSDSYGTDIQIQNCAVHIVGKQLIIRQRINIVEDGAGSETLGFQIFSAGDAKHRDRI